MEVELKYSFDSEQTFQLLLEATSLGGFRLEPEGAMEVHDCYLDTEGNALLKSGYACRLRREYDCSPGREYDCSPGREGGRYLATLKGLGDADGAYHRRVEHEVALPEPLLPPDWPPGPARRMVLRLCGEQPLLTLFELRQERFRRRLCDGERAAAELSLDRVQCCDDQEVRASWLELEAELLPDGGGQDLDRLAAALDGIEGLAPQPKSKFERGLARLQSARQEQKAGPETEAAVSGAELAGGPEAPAKPQEPALDADDPMSEAGRKTLRYHFQRMIYHEPGTRLGQDAEALHDMRVATRRMRAAFRVFGEFFDAQAVAPYLKGLKRTGRALGRVRDLDVLQEKALAYLDSLPEAEREGLQALFSAIDLHREEARARMLDYLDGAKYARFRERFGRFVHTEGMGSLPVTPDGGEPRPFRVRHVAPTAVYERLGVVRAYDEWVLVPDPPLERLHALRIACKRLRYTLEFFEQVLGPGTKDAIKRVVAVQDHLGALQDAVVASGILGEFLATGSWGKQKSGDLAAGGIVPDPGVEAYLAARQAEVRYLVETFPEVWQQIAGSDFGHMMAAIVAVL